MKTKASLIVLPLLCAAGLASAQGASPAAVAPGAAQAADMQGQRPGEVRDSHDRYREKPRQGRDMRRCLNLKTGAAIIRCAEPGRKP